jgi:hypothetical protein
VDIPKIRTSYRLKREENNLLKAHKISPYLVKQLLLLTASVYG